MVAALLSLCNYRAATFPVLRTHQVYSLIHGVLPAYMLLRHEENNSRSYA